MKFILTALSACLLLSSCKAQPEGDSQANRLIHSQSPYLLQHAYNPVNWFPWGEEAQEQAQETGKLMVVSIGYAACHWCHVMEHESFEDSTVATLMNQHFVSVKVDREERPDVDAIYMNACELLSRGGCGWPLNVITLPDGRPIFAGTYFPKEQWMNVLRRVQEVYTQSPEKAEDLAKQLSIQLEVMQGVDVADEGEYTLSDWEKVGKTLLGVMDQHLGGRKGAPKFPMPNNLIYLLEYASLSGDTEAQQQVYTSLDLMAERGLYDHLGGGFARYSTDEAWKVPHFEKMLYDNGQLVSLYAKAYQYSQNPVYADVVRETLAFVERELTNPEGGFYSSLDADSEGEEGKFYVWSLAEIQGLLGEEASLFAEFYHMEAEGNWEEGKNILWKGSRETQQTWLTEKGLSEADWSQKQAAAQRILFEARAKRVSPGLDDKQITAWNGLMIKGYVDAFRALQDSSYLKAATRAAHHILSTCMSSDGRLDRIYKDGSSSINAFLDDYAALAEAFIALYEITFDPFWLKKASSLTEYALKHFKDDQTQLFFYTSDLDDPLLTRSRETTDKVIPSSNSIMARVLFLLGSFHYTQEWVAQSTYMVNRMRSSFTQEPSFFSNWARLSTYQVFAPYEVAIMGSQAQLRRQEMDQHFLPNVVFLGGDQEGDLTLLQNKLVDGQTTIYVCTNKICKLPVRDTESALGLIQRP